jgi:Ca2+-binding RTX toxin-like protein
VTQFNGGSDDDVFVGGIDGDQADGGGGSDILFGLGGNDVLNGGTGEDSLDGGDGFDRLYSDVDPGAYQRPYFGNPMIIPVLDRRADRDSLTGGAGDDVISAGYGDTVVGGSGEDRLLISLQGATSGVTADFRPLDSGASVTIGGATISGIEGIEWLEGSEFGDFLAPNGVWANYAPVFGMGGNDTIIGAYYTGEVFGGEGNDTIDTTQSIYGFGSHGDGGDDTITGTGNIDGGTGDDTITGTGSGMLHGGDGNEVITHGSTSNNSCGDAGNDIIYGRGGGNAADGGEGDELINCD